MPDNPALKLLFVINPGSGGKKKDEWETQIRNYFTDKRFQPEYYVLGRPDDKDQIRRLLTEQKPDRLVAVGGDGTVTMLAKEVKNTAIALGILPAGSANGMAKELGIPENLRQALDIVVKGIVKKVDLIRINEEYCLHLSDIGLNAQLIKYFDEGKLRGKLGYAKVMLKVLWNKQMMDVTVGMKQEEIRRKAFMVVIANASKYGTGAVINPEGNIDDGLFEVIIVRRLALSELLKMIFKPQPFNPKKIEVFHARSITIETRRRAHFQVDGEYLGKVNRVTGTIEPSAIQMVLPVGEP